MDDVRKCKSCGSTQYEIQFLYIGYRERLLIIQCRDCRDKIIPVVVDYFIPETEIYGLCQEKWNEANEVPNVKVTGLPQPDAGSDTTNADCGRSG